MSNPEIVIDVQNLAHRYKNKTIYDDLSFHVEKGKIFGLLGRNGVGKTTLINILMGFLKPCGGICRVLGEDSHAISSETRQKIGLLFEGHLTYDFMNIDQAEHYYGSFYDKWDRDAFYDLVNLLDLPKTHKIAHMSCGQRSQVVLGLLFAQQPELFILDDYSLGLDAGYRRLFLEYLDEHVRGKERTVMFTSHVVQDMEQLVDEILFLDRGGKSIQKPLDQFMTQFRCFFIPGEYDTLPEKNETIINAYKNRDGLHLYTYTEEEMFRAYLDEHYSGLLKEGTTHMQQETMSLEDAFIGLMGKY